jgi:hypothetical protein
MLFPVSASSFSTVCEKLLSVFVARVSGYKPKYRDSTCLFQTLAPIHKPSNGEGKKKI